MAILGGWVFLLGGVPLYLGAARRILERIRLVCCRHVFHTPLQFAFKILDYIMQSF